MIKKSTTDEALTLKKLVSAKEKYYDELMFKAIVGDTFSSDDAVDFYTASNQYINSSKSRSGPGQHMADNTANASKAQLYGSVASGGAGGGAGGYFTTTTKTTVAPSNALYPGSITSGGYVGVSLTGTPINIGQTGTHGPTGTTGKTTHAMKTLQSNVIIKTKYIYTSAIALHLDMYLLKNPNEEPNFGFVHMSSGPDTDIKSILCFSSQKAKAKFEEWLGGYKTLFQHEDDIQLQQYPTPPVGEICLVRTKTPAKSTSFTTTSVNHSNAGRRAEWEFICQRCYGQVGLMECGNGSYWAFSDPNDAVVFQLGMEKE